MTFWMFYFGAKILLCLLHHLKFDLFLNYLLGAYALLPLAMQKLGAEPWQIKKARVPHLVLGVVLAFLLLWHDTYFPPLQEVIRYLSDPGERPTGEFAGDFVKGYLWNPETLALLGLFAACIGIQKIKRAPRYVFGALALITFGMKVSSASNGSPSDLEKSILQKNSGLKAHTPILAPKEGEEPFDVILIQLCSMSWEDLTLVGLDQDPFFSRFEVLFTRFNTATGYSTPAGLRLLRSTCGQVSHTDLFQETPPECQLLENLKRAGYGTHTVFNHQGTLSTKMAHIISKLSGAAAPMALDSFKPESVSYDGTPIYNNFEVLNSWWKKRIDSKEVRSALYYDTVSLHTGAHSNTDPEWWKESHLDHYRKSARKTFSELSRFFELIEASGKKALVLVVSEHGAALQGSPMQRAELRDIPLPSISTVPMGAFWIGKSGSTGTEQIKIETPVTYPVVPMLINEAIQARTFDPKALRALPPSPFLAENENAATLIQNHHLYYRAKDGKWLNLPSELIPEGMSE